MTTTTPKEWREKRQQGIEITLPEYGDVVFIRPMDAELFFKLGKLPDFLAPVMQRILGNERYDMPLPATDDDEKTREWIDWLNSLIEWTFVSPKVVDTPQRDDEIGIDEVSYADKLFIYSLFGRPAQVLRKFRREPSKPVATMDAPKADETQAVQSNAG